MLCTPLTPEQRAALEAQLADARASYHAIMTGTKARVIVDRNGERVEFSAVNAALLANYIRSLEAQLATTPCGVEQTWPANFIF